jgi:4-oxalocrotonate tautomerase
MPVISITLKAIAEEQKKTLVERLTAEAVNITQIKAENFIVLINELPLENMGIGGKTVKAMLSGK